MKQESTEKNYILIWFVDDYLECGGGYGHAFFETIEQVAARVNEIAKEYKTSIKYCYELGDEIKFKPVEKVTRWEVDDDL